MSNLCDPCVRGDHSCDRIKDGLCGCGCLDELSEILPVGIVPAELGAFFAALDAASGPTPAPEDDPKSWGVSVPCPWCDDASTGCPACSCPCGVWGPCVDCTGEECAK